MRSKVLLASLLIIAASAKAQLVMSESKGDFNLLGASVLVGSDDDEVVRKAAGMFRSDVKAVSGVTLPDGISKTCVIAGTIGRSAVIGKMMDGGKLPEATAIQGDWERFAIQVVRNPMPGVSKALVVAGSDRRGTAYGLLHLSELIGQNPWCWWADVPARQHKHIYLSGKFTEKRPSVKYRGLFINDEDWGLTPWAAKTYEPERKNIGPRTYARVCELLLRLHANYLCPAMHPVSTSFYSIPENKLVADSFAIVMGTSHCEPLFLNTASDWDCKTMGEWDYDKNRQGILDVLERRVRETIPYENVYTLALRGLHDAHMNGGGVTMRQKVELLQNALMDQRHLIEKNTDRPIEQVPQAFTPYKEVLDIYSAGLQLPEDITIIWPDDNFGYMKRLSNPDEQKRSGRSGVYYHLSYLGVPHSYLWFGTTPPALMYEELRKAYDNTADAIWLANAGDIKGTEASLALFLAMAKDMEAFTPDNVVEYHAQWMAGMFGQEHLEALRDILQTQYRLSFQRKPEYMGFGYWNNCWGAGGEKRTDTGFSLSNYNEFERRLSDYERISRLAEQIYEGASDAAKPAVFQLLLYPIKGSYLMNRMTMGGQLYRDFVRQQRGASDLLRQSVENDHETLVQMTQHYNDMMDGKWRHVMSLEQNYDGMAAYFKVPRMEAEWKPQAHSEVMLSIEGEGRQRMRSAIRQLPTFSKFQQQASHWIDVYEKSAAKLNYTVRPQQDWILVEKAPTSAAQLCMPAVGSELQERLDVRIDWAKVPVGDAVAGEVVIGHNGKEETIHVSVFNPAEPSVDALRGMFVEHNGYVSIPAADFTRKFENERFHIFPVKGLGVEGTALQLGLPTEPLQPYRDNMPNSRVEYDFYTFNAGLVDVYTYVLPTFPLHSERDYKMPEHTNADTKYSVRIDNGNIASPTSSAIEYTDLWYSSVLGNCRVNKSTLYIHEPGRHTLAIRAGDPSTVIQKIVIDMGGQQQSYAGPMTTQVK